MSLNTEHSMSSRDTYYSKYSDSDNSMLVENKNGNNPVEELSEMKTHSDLEARDGYSDSSAEMEEDLESVVAYFDNFIKANPLPEREPEQDTLNEDALLALDYLRENEGVDFELVEVSSFLTPTNTRKYGYGIHFNFIAKLKGTESRELFFVEMAFGDPPEVIRCVRLTEPPSSMDAKKYVVLHPKNEECVFCENAENDHRIGNYYLPPCLM